MAHYQPGYPKIRPQTYSPSESFVRAATTAFWLMVVEPYDFEIRRVLQLAIPRLRKSTMEGFWKFKQICTDFMMVEAGGVEVLGHIDNTEVVGFQVPSRLPKPRFPATLARFGTVTPLKGKLGRTVPERSECLPATDLSAFICANEISRQEWRTRADPPSQPSLRVADHTSKWVTSEAPTNRTGLPVSPLDSRVSNEA
jgi:hypothetical protein